MKSLSKPVILYSTTNRLRRLPNKTLTNDEVVRFTTLLSLYEKGTIDQITFYRLFPKTEKILTTPESYFCRSTFAFVALKGNKIAVAWTDQNPLDTFSRKTGRREALRRLSRFLKNDGAIDGNYSTIYSIDELPKNTKLYRTAKWQLDLLAKKEQPKLEVEKAFL